MNTSKIYRTVRNHPITTRVIPMVFGVILCTILFGMAYAEGNGQTVSGFFQSTDAYWGYGLGATSGFGFSEWLNRRAWQARDRELERLREIEKEHNVLRDKALEEKLSQVN